MERIAQTLLGIVFITISYAADVSATTNNTETASAAVPTGLKTQEDRARQRRLEWNLDTLVGDYERHGSRNTKWDDAAKLALERFATARVTWLNAGQDLMPSIANDAK